MNKTLFAAVFALAFAGSALAAAEPAATPPAMPAASAPAPATVASAPIVPAIDKAAGPVATTAPLSPESQQMPPPVNLLSGIDSKLTPREREAVKMANAWKTATATPSTGQAGRVVWRFGATLPTLVCAPLFVCEIELQPGEVVDTINVGDPVRFMVSPSQVGEGPTATTHITVKPTDTGLTTNMIISTNRRNYTIKLVSRKDDWMPLVAFSYPEDEAAAWAAYHDAQRRYKEQTVIPETGQSVEHLDFDYALSGDRPSWTPLRVYNDGVKTYIQFPPSVKNTTAPSLVSLGTDGGIFKGPSTQLVNYRVAGDRYVVDKVLDRAALIIGVGKDQVRVEINHKRKGG